MNGSAKLPTDYRQFSAPPCAVVPQGNDVGQQMMQGQQNHMQSIVPPRQDLLRQTPTGIPQGSDFGLGPALQQDMMQQPANATAGSYAHGSMGSARSCNNQPAIHERIYENTTRTKSSGVFNRYQHLASRTGTLLALEPTTY